MGRAYSVRKESIQKTGAAKAKLYSMYSREIYQIAKTGGTNIDSNLELKRVIERAKREQIPSTIINRAIEKVNCGVTENYDNIRYEAFGPSGSTLIIDCLTDNVNRALSYIRPALTKNGGNLGVNGSVSYMYDHLSVVSFKELDEERVLNIMIDNDIDIDDIEVEKEIITIFAKPNQLFKIKDAITNTISNVEFIIEEITMIPKTTVKLKEEDLGMFKRMLKQLEDAEDVQNIYHNVDID